MYKRIGAAAVVLLLGGLAWFSMRSPEFIPRAFDDACADEGLSTFNVSVVPSKSTYAVGDTARFKVVVTRALKTDEHEQGEDLGPAEGADVLFGLSVGARSVAARGVTDAAGAVNLSMRLPGNMPAGPADALAFAKKETVILDCVPHESGHFDAEGLIRIRR